MPLIPKNFARQFDRRFSKIFDLAYNEDESKIPMLFSMPPTRKGPDEKYATEGDLDDFTEHEGAVNYGELYQQYEVTAKHRPFNKGMIIERELIDDALFNRMEEKPRKMGRAAARTREAHAARFLTMAFANDTYFYTHEEGVPVCSNVHKTKSGASTAVGFDNLAVSAMSAVAFAANRIQMRNFRNDRGSIISPVPDEVWIPTELYETAYEIVSSLGKVETANNNANVHYGQYRIVEWQYMTNATNWFMMDSRERKSQLKWHDRIPLEFGNVQEFDTWSRKWRAYMRYSYVYVDWRFIVGNQVS